MCYIKGKDYLEVKTGTIYVLLSAKMLTIPCCHFALCFDGFWDSASKS